MKKRVVLHTILSLLVAVMLIVCATAFATGYSRSPAEWMRVHQYPLLWLIDFTALYTLILMATLIRAQKRQYRHAEELHMLREEHGKQLGAMVAQAAEMEDANARNIEHIEALEAEQTAQREMADNEAVWQNEQVIRALQSQVEAHARQLDAVNMALQYHRAEMTQMRHCLRTLQTDEELAAVAQLTPAEKAALSGPPSPALLESSPSASRQELSEALRGTTAAVQNGPQRMADSASGEQTVASLMESAASHATSAPAFPVAAVPSASSAVSAAPHESAIVFEPTANASSTYVTDIAEYDVLSASSSHINE